MLKLALKVLEPCVPICPQKLVAFQISGVSDPTVAAILAQIRTSIQRILISLSFVSDSFLKFRSRML